MVMAQKEKQKIKAKVNDLQPTGDSNTHALASLVSFNVFTFLSGDSDYKEIDQNMYKMSREGRKK